MSVEVVTRDDFERFKDELRTQLSNLHVHREEKEILSLNDVKKVTGYSDSKIQSLIEDKKLNPWKDSDKHNSKLNFYRREVISLIPESLREKYG